MLEAVAATTLAASQTALAGRIADLLRAGDPPLIQLCGPDERIGQAVAAAAAASLGLRLLALRPETLVGGSVDVRLGLLLCEREALLSGSALCVHVDGLDRADQRTGVQLAHLLERTPGPVFVCARDRWRPVHRTTHSFDVGKASTQEQVLLWQGLLDEAGVEANSAARDLGRQFNLSDDEIRASVRQALASDAEADLAGRLWAAGRSHARPRLDDLAQRLEPRAKWDDLVLPQTERDMLATIATQVAHRQTVHHEWGFAARGSRGLGISALFAGASGTGKTMAAEVVAHTLRLDLYRIDLAERGEQVHWRNRENLRRVFDAAEDGGAILFFDEADALFGKRTEVRDSHDRFANLEVNYLLQRMESIPA